MKTFKAFAIIDNYGEIRTDTISTWPMVSRRICVRSLHSPEEIPEDKTSEYWVIWADRGFKCVRITITWED